MEPVVDVRGLWKAYGASVVLEDVDLSIDKGAMVAITGRSGSGKSTLFKLLAGLDRPTRGSIRIAGRDISQLSDEEMSELRLHRLGLVFQSFNLLPDLTVEANVRLPLDIAKVPRAAGRARAAQLLELLGIGVHGTKKPHQLSGGEQQRAAIARALANDPIILLADEPTGNLDRSNAENVLRAFDEVNERLGTTVMLITHDPLAIQHYPSRLELVDGRVEWRTPVSQLN
ncbi:MAG TPA: ABC transporter ATP-binding protein [Candidatus Thermoplasmatota archaeon]|nr:ABC transporter ATP-binding protein [Candidatus Thermoplasmatota archaeon]